MALCTQFMHIFRHEHKLSFCRNVCQEYGIQSTLGRYAI